MGVNPGADMLYAIKQSKKYQLQMALVDRDISVTLKRFSKGFTFREKMRLLKEIILAPFSKKKIAFDISKIPSQEVIKTLINQIKTRYPSIYRVLIDERNKYMAKRIFKISLEKKVLCVVGAGHEEGLIEELKKLYYSNPTSF